MSRTSFVNMSHTKRRKQLDLAEKQTIIINVYKNNRKR